MDRRGGREPPLWLEGCRWRHLRWAASSPPCLCGSVGPEGGWLAVLWVGRSWLVGPREPKKKKSSPEQQVTTTLPSLCLPMAVLLSPFIPIPTHRCGLVKAEASRDVNQYKATKK